MDKTPKELLTLLQQSYSSLKEATLTEETLGERYQELFGLLGELRDKLAQEQGERFNAILEASLEEELKKAEEEAAQQFPDLEDLPEPEPPKGPPKYDQELVLKTFIEEAPALVNYRRERELTDMFRTTSVVLERLPEDTELNGTSKFIKMFIDVDSTMADRREGITKLVTENNNGEQKSENMKSLLTGVFAYADQTSTRRAMAAMGMAIRDR